MCTPNSGHPGNCNSTITLPGSRTVMPFLVKGLKILLVYLVVAVMAKKGLVLDLNIMVEVTEGSEKDELTLKQVMTIKRYKYSLPQ
jgi:hypothetical protein